MGVNVKGSKNVKSGIYDCALMALFTAVIVICSWISVDIGPVPFTLQTFAVLCSGGLLKAKKGVTSVFTYMLLGAAGLPVFSGFRSGFGVLLSSTGGYVVGFLLTALIAGIAADRFGKCLWKMILAMIAGVAACYILGVIWFVVVYLGTKGAVNMGSVLMTCVVPFLIPDCIKSIAAAVVVSRVKKCIR